MFSGHLLPNEHSREQGRKEKVAPLGSKVLKLLLYVRKEIPKLAWQESVRTNFMLIFLKPMNSFCQEMSFKTGQHPSWMRTAQLPTASHGIPDPSSRGGVGANPLNIPAPWIYLLLMTYPPLDIPTPLDIATFSSRYLIPEILTAPPHETRDTHLPVDRQTPVKTLPSTNFVCVL